MTTLVDSGPNSWDLSTTGEPLLEQPGYTGDKKAIIYYNASASTEANKWASTNYNCGTSLQYLPPDGCIIEIICSKLVDTSDFTSNKGRVIFSINGTGESANGTLKGLGSFAIGICSTNGKPGTGGTADAGKIFVAWSREGISIPSNLTTYALREAGYGKVVICDTTKIDTSESFEHFKYLKQYNQFSYHEWSLLEIVLSYKQSSFDGDNLLVEWNVNHNGHQIMFGEDHTPLISKMTGYEGRIPVSTINIGGFPFAASQTPSGAKHSKASFPGAIEQVILYDQPYHAIEVDRANELGLYERV